MIFSVVRVVQSLSFQGSAVISKEIKYCKAFNPSLIKPNIIIDAVGEPDELGM